MSLGFLSHTHIHTHTHEKRRNVYISPRASHQTRRESRRVYSRVRRNHIDCRQEDFGVALSVSISFTTGVGPFSRRLPRAGRSCVFLSLPPRLSPPGSHSIRRSRSVVTALRLYKFYIIFMRHKVVEKPTEGGKRVRARERSATQGKGLSVRVTPSCTLFTPASRRCSHVAGRSGSHPLVLARPRGVRREGNADESGEG